MVVGLIVCFPRVYVKCKCILLVDGITAKPPLPQHGGKGGGVERWCVCVCVVAVVCGGEGVGAAPPFGLSLGNWFQEPVGFDSVCFGVHAGS